MTDDDTFETTLAALSNEARPIVEALDKMIHDENPDVVRVAWPTQRTVGYGVGERKMTEHYAYIAVYGDVVNLGFNYGALLDDPEQILEGSGAKFRKHRVSSPSVAFDPSLRQMIARARSERVHALGR